MKHNHLRLSFVIWRNRVGPGIFGKISYTSSCLLELVGEKRVVGAAHLPPTAVFFPTVLQHFDQTLASVLIQNS